VRRLRATFPSTHVFAIWRGDRAFVGATPERLVRLEGDVVQSSSLAGSIGRGSDAGQDAQRAAALLGSAKDRAEHEMVRRVLCAGLAAVCDDLEASDEPSILTLPHVHHLHTPVRARLRAGHTLLELVGRLHPTPAVGGTPYDAALQFLRVHEGLDRGWYAAPVGWLGATRGEFAVALRSAVIAGQAAWLFAGCGIVADSRAESEYEESVLKLRPMQLALATAVTDGDADAAPTPRLAAAGGHATR
jgi:isochorismate synthase